MGVPADKLKKHVVKWLLEGGLGFHPARDAIGCEVLFSRRWRRADLLVLSSEFHALEIKSETDSLKRLLEQLEDYHRVFDKVSVVATTNHRAAVSKLVLPSTGIIVYDGTSMRISRKAKARRRLDKRELATFLSKQIMAKKLGVSAARFSTDQLRQLAASKLSIAELRSEAYAMLWTRYLPLFRLFYDDIGGQDFAEDDLRSLCGSISPLTS